LNLPVSDMAETDALGGCCSKEKFLKKVNFLY
jgi:hypothetical protein